MAFNGSGTFLINTAGQPVVPNTVISATAFNALTADLANGLSTCITKDGQTTPTANIPMGNNKITGLAAGTAGTDAANLSQVQGSTAKLLQSVTGTDTITAAMVPALTAYAAGQMFYFVAAGDNTGAVTINIDSLGAKSVTRDGSTALVAGDITNGKVVVIVYDGTRFQLLNSNAFTNLYVSGNLGVGTASPSARLHVQGNQFRQNDATNTFGYVINTTSSTTTLATLFGGSSFAIQTGNSGTNQLFLDSSGNLGLGTASPAAKLDVQAPLLDMRCLSTTGTNYVRQRMTNTGGDFYYGIDGSAGANFGVNYGAVLWYTGAYPMVFATNNTERMRLDSSGNLGIGTTSPSGTLGRNITLNSTNAATNSGIVLQSAGAERGYIYASDTQTVVGSSTSIPLIMVTSGAERMRLDTSGNLGVGNVLAENSIGVYLFPTSEMRVKSNIENGSSQISIYNVNTLPDAEQFFVGMNLSDVDIGNKRAGALKFYTNGSERARITSAGNIVAGASVALATTATDGFLYVPTCAGTPTGTPTAITGMAPIVVNTTNNKLYFYSGGAWRDAGP